MVDGHKDNGWLGLTGDVCVVTGAVGGMGTAIAAELAHAGARLALVDISEEHTAAYAAQLAAEYGVEARGYGCDVSDADDVEIVKNRIVADFDTVDVLVNTVGILRFAPLEDLPLSDWKDVINVNLTGAFILSQAFGKVMLEHRAGRIVHISTVASHSPETFSGAYSCAKAGLGMLSKMIAAEWGPFGIRSNCVCPCFVKTPMSASFYADPKVTEERERLIASRRIGEVQDIANAVAFLASKRSDFVNGDEVSVDGGFHLMMGDLTPKPGGRRQFAINSLKQRGLLPESGPEINPAAEPETNAEGAQA